MGTGRSRGTARTGTAGVEREGILTRDFFPGLTPYVRWLRTPLGSLGSAAVASCLCGMFLHPQGFVVGFGVLVVTTLGLIWPWLIVRGLYGSLELRSVPMPRGGIGHGPDDPRQPDALGRLGCLGPGRIPGPGGE